MSILHLRTLRKEKYSFERAYLDEIPALDTAIKTWLDDLDPTVHEAFLSEAEPIECRRRDGFIPASHNHGGYERTGYTILSSAAGSGYSYGFGDAIDDAAMRGYEMAQEQFMDDRKEALKGIPKEKVNYRDLYELKLGGLAEELIEYEDESNREAVWLGIRVMFHGFDADLKTFSLTVFTGGNISEYYGPFSKGSKDMGEYEIQFKNVTELKKKLKAITKKVEATFI